MSALARNAAVDIGNTFAKIGWFDDETLVAVEKNIPVEKLEAQLLERLPAHAIFSSTSQETSQWVDILKDRGSVVFQLTPMLPLPIEKDYDTPMTLGADRVAAAVGAKVLFPDNNCLVIDMGTCVTYDWVSKMGVFGGGIISPGFRMRFQAMNAFTKRLPFIDITPSDFIVPQLIGKSTRAAMESGVFNGLLVEIEGVIERYRSEQGECQVLLCGGDAPLFENSLKSRIFAAPNVVLTGLNRILQYNINLQNA